MKRKMKMLTALLLALSMCLSQPAQIVLATDSVSVDVTADDSEIASEGESEESAEAEEIEEETDEEALVDDSADVLLGEDTADGLVEGLEDTEADIASEADFTAEAAVDDQTDIVEESLADDEETLIKAGNGQEILSAAAIEVGISLTSEDISTSENASDTEENNSDTTNTSSIPDDVCVFNGHSYKLYTSASSYEDAMAKCEELGGHLATITSAEEDEYLYAMVTGQGYLSAYFGLLKTDDDSWVWVNGEEVSYTNWGEDEPNNEDGDEFYGQYHYSDTTGGWNDANWGDGGTTYICEWDSFSIPSDAYTFNGHNYKLYSYASSYSDAMTECIERGGYLATITSAEEDEFLYNMIQELGYSTAYFGLIKESDSWAWVTEEEVSYTNWGDGEPNNMGGDEVYGQYYQNYPNGEWNDAEWGDGGTAYICEWDEEDVEASGTCGDNLTWEIADGILTISGTGEMFDYSLTSPAPWSEYDIVSLVIEDGVTNIGDYAFYGSGFTTPAIADSVTTIGDHAFENASMLIISLPCSLTSIGDSAFASCNNLASIAIPASVSTIWDNAFNDCSALTKIGFEGNAPQIALSAFSNDVLTAYYNSNDNTWTEEVKKDYGGETTWSDGITITKQPENVVTETPNVTLNIEADGFDLTYLWFYKESEENNWIQWDNASITMLYNAYIKNITAYCYIIDGVGNEISSNEMTITFSYSNIWNFGIDDFCFTNASKYWESSNNGAPVYDSYYIDDNMLSAYLDTLKNGDKKAIAKMFTNDGEVSSLENNDLETFCGACYGMCLLASLIKVGYVSPESIDTSGKASTAHELSQVYVTLPNNNENLQSILCLYHISQAVCKVSSKKEGNILFPSLMKDIWQNAYNIKSSDQIFIIYMAMSEDKTVGHAVLCYGAEECEEYIIDGQIYDKRLLIYNPNSASKDYLYIEHDYKAAFSYYELNHEKLNHDTYGIYMSGSGSMNVGSLDIPHSVYLNSLISAASLDEDTSNAGSYSLLVDNDESGAYIINDNSGEYISVSDGVIIDGTLDASLVWPVGILDGDDDAYAFSVYSLYLPSTSEYYVLSPSDGNTMDALLTYKDFSVNLSGVYESATFYTNGIVDIKDAEGSLIIDITLNNSEFDYITVNGTADGDVRFQITDDNIVITGNLSNYTVVNMNNDCEYSIVYVKGNTDVQATMENEKVTLYTDADGDEVYESPLPHAHYYTYQDNGDATHTATCIGGDDTYTEAHTYVDGVCEYCGAEEPSTVVSSGTCGENLNWTLDEDGTLTISGTGDMEESDSTTQNWAEYVASITSVIIEDGVTTIGAYAFCDCDSLESITIPDSVVSIGENAFYSCDSLTDVYYAGSESSWEQILIATGNDSLTAAEIHYGSSDETENPGEDSGTTGEDSESTGGDSGASGEDSSGSTGEGGETSDEGSGTTGEDSDDSGSASGSDSTGTESSDGSSDTGASTESSGGSDTDSTSSEASSVTDSTAVEGIATDGSAGTISAEETTSESGNVTAAESVQTGDEGMPFALLAVLFLSGAAISALAVKRRRYGAY